MRALWFTCQKWISNIAIKIVTVVATIKTDIEKKTCDSCGVSFKSTVGGKCNKLCCLNLIKNQTLRVKESSLGC